MLVAGLGRFVQRAPMPRCVVGIVLACFVLTGPPAAGAVLDDFDDEATSPAWLIAVGGTGPTIVEAGGHVEVSLPADARDGPVPVPGIPPAFSAAYALKCPVRGDFDVQVGYRLLEWPAVNGAGVRLVARTVPALVHAGEVQRRSLTVAGAPLEFYLGAVGDQAGGGSAAVFPTGDAAGVLRLVRRGEIVVSYWAGSADGAFVPLVAARAPTADVSIAFGAFSREGEFGGRGVRVAFDHFRLSDGEPVCDAPRCGDVNADGRIDVSDALLVAQFGIGLRQCAALPFGWPETCDVNPQATAVAPGLQPDGACDVGDALKLAQCSVGLVACDLVCGPFACPPGVHPAAGR